jgi:catechol 2,3-dioxygenase-like lactoylglutathione lyase family enzyme
MRLTAADHINIRVRDVPAALAFYRDVLGLEPDRLEDYEAGKRPLFAFRVNETFIVHVFPDAEAVGGQPGGYDHLALVVEGTTPSELVRYLEERGVPIEMQTDRLWGARGDGWACYVRDPDGYRVELKIYEGD